MELHCGVERVLDVRTATAICTVCGDVQMCQEYTTPTPAGRRASTRIFYSRIAHFRKWIMKLEGQDNIPEGVCQTLTTTLQKLPVAIPSAATMRQVLQRTGYSKYTNSLPALYAKIYKIVPPRLTDTERLTTESIFRDIEDTFVNQVQTSDRRRNLLSYSYLLEQILRVQGLLDRFVYLKPLKHQTVAREAQEIWELICEILEL